MQVEVLQPHQLGHTAERLTAGPPRRHAALWRGVKSQQEHGDM
jgi:hypothetical protein